MLNVRVCVVYIKVINNKNATPIIIHELSITMTPHTHTHAHTCTHTHKKKHTHDTHRQGTHYQPIFHTKESNQDTLLHETKTRNN